MIVENEFLSKIRDLGINSYEAKLWTALLSRGIATAGELSDIANVPRSRSYDVLESLERKGFIIMKLGKPIKYIAVPPQEVVERVKQKIREDADEKDKMLDNMGKSDILSTLQGIYESSTEKMDPSEMTGVIKGQRNVVAHMNNLLKQAKKSVSLITTNKTINIVDDLRKGLAKATKNGASVRVITSNKPSISPKSVIMKQRNGIDLRFLIVDNEHVFVLPVEAGPGEFGVWVKSDSFAKNFENMFSSLWSTSA
jgi:sugar-specific transcriptional regulator TrmB